MLKALPQLFRRFVPGPVARRARLAADRMPSAIYAVGDVHGRLDLLITLERQIVQHGAEVPGPKWIVMLGDYVDRGPSSAQVLDHLRGEMPENWKRICLAGNHEVAMAAAMDGQEACLDWLAFGGAETLASYGVSSVDLLLTRSHWKRFSHILQSHIPDQHLQFLSSLPVLLEAPGFVFVHAGLRSSIPMADQPDTTLIWHRHDESAQFEKTVVHGHTIVTQPLVTPRAINVDIGAYRSGRLACVCLKSGQTPEILIAERPIPLAR